MSNAPTRGLGAIEAALALIVALLLIAWFVPLQNTGLTVSFTGDGSVLESPDGSRVELEAGAEVQAGDRIIIPGGGSANLVSPDGHNITLGDSTTLTVSESRATLIGGRVHTEVEVDEGSVRVSGEGRVRTSLDIGLPHGIAGVRGTEFDVSVAGETTALSVHEGSVGLETADGSAVDLGAGEGAVITEAGSTVAALPGSPTITAPATNTTVDAQGTTLTWTAVAGAASYAVEFAADAAFLQTVARVNAAAPSVEIPALPEDQGVFVRVFAVTDDGLRSTPSAAVTLEIRLRLALGLLSLTGGDVAQSITEFEAALPNYSDDVQLLADLGWSYFLAERYEDARGTYQQARDLEPEDMDILLELGRAHFMVEDYTAAEETYQAALALQPEDADALWGLGDTYRAAGRADEALALVRRAVAVQPDHPYAGESLRMLQSGG